MNECSNCFLAFAFSAWSGSVWCSLSNISFSHRAVYINIGHYSTANTLSMSMIQMNISGSQGVGCKVKENTLSTLNVKSKDPVYLSNFFGSVRHWASFFNRYSILFVVLYGYCSVSSPVTVDISSSYFFHLSYHFKHLSPSFTTLYSFITFIVHLSFTVFLMPSIL